jgi:hypothetical protein
MRSFALLAVAVATTLSVSTPAFAGWTEILSLSVPFNGTFATTDLVRTSRVKLVKEGADCRRVRASFSALGRDLSGNFVLALGLNFLGENSRGDGVYQVVPTATIYDFQMQMTAGSRRSDCTYTFYAETLDLD